MDTQDLIENRQKIQFHSDLAFGKIHSQETKTLTANASGQTTHTFSHSFPSKPKMVGWGIIAGSAERIPMFNWYLGANDILGFDIEIYPFSTSTQYGFHFVNRDGSSRSIQLNYWFYFI